MSKKIMIVGAGKYQLAGIVKAKELGYYVIATDGDPNAPGLKLAEESFVVDVMDAVSNLRIAKEKLINGVFSIASDVSLKTVALIAESLGLPGVGTAVADKCTDKELMRQAFYQAGVPSPQSYAVHNLDEMRKRALEIGYPLVIKPADSAGSRGVKMINALSEMQPAYEQAIKFSKKGKVLIEEYMAGVEVSVEAFLSENKINIICLSDKVRTQPPFLLDREVIFPSAYNTDIKKQIIDVATRAIGAVSLELGPVHMELMMTKHGPVPVELAARGPGFKVFTDIMPMITGIDLTKAVIELALGQKPDLTRTKNRAAVIKFIDGKNGILKKISGLDQARQLPGIHELELYIRIGDRVHALTCGSDRIGHIISVADNREAALKSIEAAERSLGLEIEADPLLVAEK